MKLKIAMAPQYCLDNSGLSTQRQWRRWKRHHLRQLRKAFRVLRLGCAYTPRYDSAIAKIEEQIVILERAWSPKEWGR